MDPLDHAAELENMHRQLALKKQAASSRLHLPSRDTCIDCDIDIPEERKALGGVERCIECEGYRLQEKRQRGF